MELLPLAFTSGWTSGINATALAVLNPLVAAVVVAILLVAGVWLTIAVMSRVRRGRRAFRRWLQRA